MTAKVSFGSFNVNGFKEGLESFSDLLTRSPPLDIVGLQEVLGMPQAEELARLLGMKVVVASRAEFGLHNVLMVREASNIEVSTTWEWVLDGGEGRERRMAVCAHCTIPKAEDRHFVVINTHLDALSEDVRLQQVRSLKGKVDALFANDHAVHDPSIDVKVKLQRLQEAFDKGSLSATGLEKGREMLLKLDAGTVTLPQGDNLLIDGWVLMGDLNSLTHGDYTDDRLAEIRTLREGAKVEAPKFAVTHELMCQYDLVDSNTLAKVKVDQTQHHTSKHQVRVDYILFSYSILTTVAEVARHTHVATDISDHSLVTSDVVML